MDFSKFSDQDLLALKNNDYSKLSDSALLQLRDTSQSASPSDDKSQAGFAKNTLQDYGRNISGNLEMAKYAFPPLAAMANAQGQNLYDPQKVAAMGPAMVEGIKQIPGQIAQDVAHPIDSFYQHPLSTAIDLGSMVDLGANLARPAIRSAAEKFGPGLMKTSAGIPEQLSEMAIKKPEILNTPPVPEAQLNTKVGQPIIDAFGKAKEMVGQRFGDIYRKIAGMEGPMQEIVDKPIAQKISPVVENVPVAQKLNSVEVPRPGITGAGTDTKLVPGEMITEPQTTGFKPGEQFAVSRPQHSFDDLIVNKSLAKEAFQNGDQGALESLYKKYVNPATDLSEVGITSQEKLQILTRLKREIQAETNFNKAPVTLAPIDSAKDAALKTMGKEVDNLRSSVPGGTQLNAADNSWKAVNDIYDTVQRDLSDPGKAKDTLMKLARGDTTWLSSGRMAGKLNAIRTVEKMTGKKILEPAMEELTRQVFQPWLGRGISQMTRLGQAGGGALALGSGHPLTALAIGASMAADSPRILGYGIRGANAMGNFAERVMPAASAPMVTSAAALDRLALARKRKQQ